MPSKHASKEDLARGKRLEQWLEQVAPDVPKSYRGEVIFEVPRQTVHSWIKGSDISNEGIRKIIEIGGYSVLAHILSAKPLANSAKIMRHPDVKQIHGKGVRFWYNQYILNKAQTILTEKQDYSKYPEVARTAIKAADDFARIKASGLRSIGSKKPRPKRHDFE